MNDKKIYCRTRMGEDSLEVTKPGVVGISGDEMRVMMLIDGKCSVAQIAQKLPPSVQSYIGEIFSRLRASRFIAETDQSSVEASLKAPARVSQENVKASLMSSQKLNKNMLVLAEIEIERRMELEEDLTVAHEQLSATRAALADVQVERDAVTNKYQTLKKQVYAYKQGMEGKIATLQKHIETMLGNRKEVQAARVQVEEDLLRMRDRFAQMEASVIASDEALDETMRLRAFNEKRLEQEKNRQLKIQADEMVQSHPYYHLVRELEFFKDFRNSDIAQFLVYAEWREVKANEIVVAEGEDSFLFYVIVTGKMAVLKGKKMLHVFHAGEPFGEIAYMDDENPLRSASIVARTDCLLLVFNPAYLDEAEMIFRMRVAEAFVRIQAKRLRRAVEVVNNLLEGDVGRI